MRVALGIAAAATLAVVASAQVPPGDIAFINGRWFNGDRFVTETVYAVNGTLTRRRPPRAAAIDLAGRYVLPPFAEAHNHSAGYDAGTNVRFLAAGVLYVKNPNSLPDRRVDANRPDSIDVAFANGGLTSSGGHPIEIADRQIRQGSWSAAHGEGGFYHTIDSLDDLSRKWPAILAARPDFIKTYLLFSEQLALRRNPRFAFRRGLDPALLPAIVARAHGDGLRVATHVESAADFHAALMAGVDEISHAPGFRGPDDPGVPADAAFLISEADAKLAAMRRTVVVTTLGGVVTALPASGTTAAARRAADTLHARNLSLLKSAGVRIVIGSDAYEDTSVGEATYVHGLGVFDTPALLRMWTMETPRAIFPDGAIGRLTDGAEANLIVLAGDPLVDFGAVRRVTMVVKRGRVLSR